MNMVFEIVSNWESKKLFIFWKKISIWEFLLEVWKMQSPESFPGVCIIKLFTAVINSLVQLPSAFPIVSHFLLALIKHTSFLCYRINYGCNKFHDIGPGLRSVFEIRIVFKGPIYMFQITWRLRLYLEFLYLLKLLNVKLYSSRCLRQGTLTEEEVSVQLTSSIR